MAYPRSRSRPAGRTGDIDIVGPSNPRPLDALAPEGDVARQAVASLRGYAYQVVAATLAWLDLEPEGRLHLEVAEDYAIVAKGALAAVQVRDTRGSGTITLTSEPVRAAIAAFVDLVGRNPGLRTNLRYLTTSEIGRERATTDRLGTASGLEGWRQAALGGDAARLRELLCSEAFPGAVRSFVRLRDDAALRRDLLQRIHWDCGRPDLTGLRHELEQRLVVIGRDRFGLPAQEARGLADTLVHHALRKSVAESAAARVLTNADLYEAIDGRTRVWLPRSAVDALARSAAGPGSSRPDPAIPSADDFFIGGATLAAPRGLLARTDVEDRAMQALRRSGMGILVGGSGLGKSIVARSMLAAHGHAFAMVEFRDDDAVNTRRRLDSILARLGGLPEKALVLEDVDHLEDSRVALALGRLASACRRRDVAVVMTTCRTPSTRTVVEVGASPDVVVPCPCFTQDEVRALVAIHDGDPERWGRLAHAAGGAGHPQLTHAFVLGMAARRWPVEEMDGVVARGLASEDTDAAREAARRNLAAALPENVRAVLYRLSLTNMRFDRELALAVGSLPPLIPQAAECLDGLVGPWIENAGRGLYRVSSLATGFGRDMLPEAERTSIHAAIAGHLLGRGRVEATHADHILVHALAGGAVRALATLAHSVMTAMPETLDLLARHSSALAAMRTDRPIFPADRTISAMLRLAQFKLAAARGEEEQAAGVARVLLADVDRRRAPVGPSFEATVLATILGTEGVANFVDDWVDLLQRFRELSGSSAPLREMEAAVDAEGFDLPGLLFAVGTSGLRSVERLEHVVDALLGLEPDDRAALLASPIEGLGDQSVMILGPYALRPRGEPFDAPNAVSTYARIAEKTKDWSPSEIPIRCRIAQATILDEHEDDEAAAFAVLDAARRAFGDDARLMRERARIQWRRRRYAEALATIRGVVGSIGSENVVDRAFGLREAAISAAKCGEWDLAETWFTDARNAADTVDIEDMRAMAAGLRADAAAAAIRGGNGERGLSGLREALVALGRVEAQASPRSAHCHRFVRFAVLWAQDRADGGILVADRALADLEAGACSDPTPSPAAANQPSCAIDIAWYVLAGAEASMELDVGIVSGLDGSLEGEPIPFLEADLRSRTMQRAIEATDPTAFAARFAPFVEAVACLRLEPGLARGPLDTLAPSRARIPRLPPCGPYAPVFEAVARDALGAFAIEAALAKAGSPLPDLAAALAGRFPSGFPGEAMVHERWAELEPSQRGTLGLIALLASPVHKEPLTIWTMALRLLQATAGGAFERRLASSMAAWFHREVSAFVVRERFRLRVPARTVLPILTVLGMPDRDRAYVARLLLASAPAVGQPLSAHQAAALEAAAAPGKASASRPGDT